MRPRERDMLSTGPVAPPSAPASRPVPEASAPSFDISRCFGHYRQQSARYALTYCLVCPKLKACVRTVWGVDEPRRGRRSDWARPARAAPRATRPTYPQSLPLDDYAAT